MHHWRVHTKAMQSGLCQKAFEEGQRVSGGVDAVGAPNQRRLMQQAVVSVR